MCLRLRLCNGQTKAEGRLQYLHQLIHAAPLPPATHNQEGTQGDGKQGANADPDDDPSPPGKRVMRRRRPCALALRQHIVMTICTDANYMRRH